MRVQPLEVVDGALYPLSTREPSSPEELVSSNEELSDEALPSLDDESSDEEFASSEEVLSDEESPLSEASNSESETRKRCGSLAIRLSNKKQAALLTTEPRQR